MTPSGEWSGQAEWMRFARLIDRPIRVLGGPSVRAAFGGIEGNRFIDLRHGSV
jgi:hypothetical protein